MFFRKKCDAPEVAFKLSPIDGIRITHTEIYDKKGKDSKLLKTEKTLQYRREDGSWEDAWINWNSPVYLDEKNG